MKKILLTIIALFSNSKEFTGFSLITLFSIWIINSLIGFKILLPSADEQVKIAEYLDIKCAEIDALIAKKEAFVEEMEAYKKSLIYEYVTGKKEVL